MKDKYKLLGSDEKKIIDNLYHVSRSMNDKNGDKLFEQMKEFLKETKDELDELAKISGKLNGLSCGGPVSLDQETMSQMAKADWIIENEEVIRYRFNELNEETKLGV